MRMISKKLIKRYLSVPCPVIGCKAPIDTPCRIDGGTHKARREWADDKVALDRQAAKRQAPPACQCRNHMRTAKQLHKSKDAALRWMVTGAERRGITGMQLEAYECPTTAGWHVRTVRAERTA